MKKLISLLILFTTIIGCEVGVYPRPHSYPPPPTVVIETPWCEPDIQDLPWVSYCDGSCCYNEWYDSGRYCQEALCYDYYYCVWEYLDRVCY